MAINKFTTLLDLARQAKILTGETATFDGKISSGIPFSGYPTGVDTATTVSLGVISSQTSVFSGGTGTTIFDVSNIYSPNYNPSFAAFSATTWSNTVFSANTSGLTLPITILSADTQIIGPFWTLTQTGYTGDYIIGTQYTGYSVTYSFNSVSTISSPNTFSGFTTASQEIFSAGTLDYKGPLDYLYSAEDATIKGRLTTDKLTIKNGASSATTNYLLTQVDDTGKSEWTDASSLLSGITIWTAGTGTNSAVLGGSNGIASGSTSVSEGINTRSGGMASHSEGGGTQALGDLSHAEGEDTIASNTASHAEGTNTIASGVYSHAEGSNTIASNARSHAEGYLTVASGVSSHSEGQSTIASGGVSHAEGSYTIASGATSHSEGDSTIAGGVSSHAEGDSSIAIGIASHAEGYQTTASGDFSHAEGYLTIASGFTSHVEGYQSTASGWVSHAEGELSQATGDNSHAEGYNTRATNYYSHSQGQNTISSGQSAHAEGVSTIAGGNASHAEGSSTTAYGDYSHAEGGSTIATGNQSHAEGYLTTASGTTSHAEGYQSTASGYASHAEGNGTLASGDYSHAEGYSGSWGVTEGRGHGSHAEGAGTLASGFVSHAEGERTIASGASSHAEGFLTIAGGYNSHAEGNLTSASNDSSHAGGFNSIASGVYSFVHGENSIATNTNTIVFGKNITGTTSETLYTNNLIIDNQNGLFTSKLGVNTSSPQYVFDVRGGVGTRLYYDQSSTGGAGSLVMSATTGLALLQANTNSGVFNQNGGISMGMRGWDDVVYTAYGKPGDSHIYSSKQSNGLNIISSDGSGTEDYIKFWTGGDASGSGVLSIHIHGTGSTKGYVGIGTINPSEKLDVNGKTKTINFQMTSGATAGYVLTSDSIGNASWQSVSGGTGGVPESTTATTTTINFTGQTIYYNATTPGTGNITENLTGSKLGLIQKIYHNDVAEPTYPAGWVLMGDAIYFTSTLNIIYAEWAFGSRVEYWYVQEQ